MGGKRRQQAIDRWKVLMTTTLIQSVIGGVVESYGALYVPIAATVFKDDANKHVEGALVGSLASGFQLGFSPVSSWLSSKLGPLVVAVFGGITVFLATFSASFARNFVTMALTYGMCLGIGCSLLFITNNIIISQHFGEESTLAFGLLGFGNGVMNSVMPHIMAYAIEKLSVYAAIRTISLILSPLMFLPFYWKELEPEATPIEDVKKSSTESSYEMSQNENNDTKLKILQKNSNRSRLMKKKRYETKKDYKFYSRQLWQDEIFEYDMVVVKNINLFNQSNISKSGTSTTTKRSQSFEFSESSVNISDDESKPKKSILEIFKVFKNRGFLNLCLAMIVSSLGYQVPNVHIVNYSNDLNLPGNAQILLTCLGGASAVGPLVNPLFIDKFEQHISKFRVFQIFVLIYGLAVTFLPLVTNFNILMFLCVLIGYSDGSFSTLIVPLIIDLVGTEKAGQCIGIYYGSISLSVTIAAPLAGYIFTVHNAYTPAFYAAGLFFISGGLMLSLTHKNFKYTENKILSNEMSKASFERKTTVLTNDDQDQLK